MEYVEEFDMYSSHIISNLLQPKSNSSDPQRIKFHNFIMEHS